jgi:hypothetical protein
MPKTPRLFFEELQNDITNSLYPRSRLLNLKNLNVGLGVKELFYYLLKQKITKDEFEVMKVFSSVNIEKEFLIQEFLDSYPSVRSNQGITHMKRYFIQFVKV